MNQPPPAIVILNQAALTTARRVQSLYAGAQVHGLQSRVEGADIAYEAFGHLLQTLYRDGIPLIVLCAAGIVIRTLAPLLQEKGAEPPVLAVAEDGSAVVPLLGGLTGVNRMARRVAEALQVPAAITTSGELRFGACLLNPPPGYVLDDLEQGKRFVADLLNGDAVNIEGDAHWLQSARLKVTNDDAGSAATHTIHVTTQARPPQRNELLIHPRSVVVAIRSVGPGLADKIREALRSARLAEKSLACIVTDCACMANTQLQQLAAQFNVPLRFLHEAAAGSIEALVDRALPQTNSVIVIDDTVAMAMTENPVNIDTIGQPRGGLTVIGLGPGATELMVPATRSVLDRATDILGYETSVNMAGPFRPEQILHCTDNREEMQRARHAFALAAQGRRVVVVSSGDPGVFAMAAAVLEALHEAADNMAWQTVDLQVIPGVSAAMATAARAGAPLGHDFCLISLSDNLKPWNVIENRLEHAAAADFVMAFYNPISKARPWQLARALDIVARHRAPQTVVVLGRDVGRPAETLTTTTLAALRPEQVDMRTMVIIGSSTTCSFPRAGGGEWVYTPRWYPA